MPLYRYQALSHGKKIESIVDADSLIDAKQKLIRSQIIVINIACLSDQEIQKPLSKEEVLSLTREITRLLQAGLPLFETLSALEEKYRRQKPHTLLLDLCEKVKTGHPLSVALSRHEKTFDLLYVAMVANAEKTGRLAICLHELAALMARQIEMGKKLFSALMYPSLLFVFCLVVLGSLLFFVIPSLKELFEGREIHLFTRVVFAVSQFACESKIFLLVLLLALLFSVGAALYSKKWKAIAYNFFFRLPILMHLFAKLALIRFCRALATLLEGGLPFIAAFGQARTVMHHPVLEKVVAEAEEKIAQGESLATSFTNHPLIPPLVPRMLGIAVQSGKLSFTMRQIAQIYEDELETTLSRFATIAQPALLLFLGALVGFVLLAVLLPLADVSSFEQ